MIDDDGLPRISDFGLSRFFDSQGGSVDRTTFKGEGSVRWQAPELLNPDRFVGIASGPTRSSDVYAFSCVCLEVSAHLIITKETLLMFFYRYFQRKRLMRILESQK